MREDRMMPLGVRLAAALLLVAAMALPGCGEGPAHGAAGDPRAPAKHVVNAPKRSGAEPVIHLRIDASGTVAGVGSVREYLRKEADARPRMGRYSDATLEVRLAPEAPRLRLDPSPVHQALLRAAQEHGARDLRLAETAR